VLVDDAGVLDGQLPARERDEPASERDVLGVERGVAEGGLGVHRGGRVVECNGADQLWHHRGTMRSSGVSLDVLRHVAAFGALGDPELTTLAACVRVRRFAAGEMVFHEGDPGATMLVVAEGDLEAEAARGDGGGAKLNRMGEGEIIGEMAFLDPAPRSATVRAKSAVLAYELDHDAMEVLRRRAPTVVAAIVALAIRDVTRRLRLLDERIEAELEKLPGALKREDA
jgi:CRP-like cAMP-binding protein